MNVSPLGGFRSASQDDILVITTPNGVTNGPKGTGMIMVVLERNEAVTEVDIKVRRPWAVAAFGLVTVGIYSVVWLYKVNRELRDYGAARGDRGLAESRPRRTLLAVTIGGLLLIPALVAYVRTVGRVQDAECIATGERRPAVGLIALWVGSSLLSIASAIAGSSLTLSLPALVVYLAASALTQARLNGVWRKGGVAGTR